MDKDGCFGTVSYILYIHLLSPYFSQTDTTGGNFQIEVWKMGFWGYLIDVRFIRWYANDVLKTTKPLDLDLNYKRSQELLQ